MEASLFQWLLLAVLNHHRQCTGSGSISFFFVCQRLDKNTVWVYYNLSLPVAALHGALNQTHTARDFCFAKNALWCLLLRPLPLNWIHLF